MMLDGTLGLKVLWLSMDSSVEISAKVPEFRKQRSCLSNAEAAK